MSVELSELKRKAFQIRKDMFNMCVKAGTGHVTSSLSCIDILVTLYHGGVMRVDPKNPDWEERDRFVLSKGQASPALYAVLADAGFFDKGELDRFAQAEGKFGVHLQHDVPGVEITSGSLGHGFGVAAGMALSAKMDRNLHMVFTMLGDGELYEGSIWETAMFASHNNLNNLVAVVDRNYLCVTDFTENLIAIEPLEQKWASFGWDVLRIDGNSIEEVLGAFDEIRSRRSVKPLVIIADTTKGEGMECISNIPLWHGLAPGPDEAKRCLSELERRYGNE